MVLVSVQTDFMEKIALKKTARIIAIITDTVKMGLVSVMKAIQELYANIGLARMSVISKVNVEVMELVNVIKDIPAQIALHLFVLMTAMEEESV